MKQFLSIADTVMNDYIKTMAEDDDKEVVAQACMSIADIMKDYGYVAIQNCGYPFLESILWKTISGFSNYLYSCILCWQQWFLDLSPLVDATLLLLTEKAACQQVEDESDIDDDDSGHDEVLMDAVSDLLPAFAKCMGSHFEPVFAKFFEPLMKFAVGIGDYHIYWHKFFRWNLGTYCFTCFVCRKLHVPHRIGQW